MKLTFKDHEVIRYLFVDMDWTVLEIAEELGFTFRQICHHVEKHCLRKVPFAVAANITKATRAGIVQLPKCA